jgi:UPF0755 protein
MDLLRKNQPWSYLFVLLILVGVYAHVLAPPANFPTGERINIPSGASVSATANELSAAQVIQHPSVLSVILRITGTSGRVHAGTYLFDTRENVLTVAYRLVTGSYHLPPASITFPEGVTVSDIAVKVAQALPLISAQDFIAEGKSQEGYLFPDTYFFPPDASSASIIKIMRANFDTKTAPLSGDVAASGHSLSDIVTMASLVEKEAQSDTDKHIVAGILWNRLQRGMALQVDADPETYAHKGLPPAPICNPGVETLTAVLHPTETKYVYYLSDKNGVIHYATTYAEQQANEAKYLH